MARRSSSKLDFEHYRNYIRKIVVDLSLEHVPITYRFVERLTYSGRMITGPRSYKVIIDTTHIDIGDTIAHELRHVWQNHNNKYTEYHRLSDREEIINWLEKEYTVREENRLFREDIAAYAQLPWEVDAEAYAAYAVQRFYYDFRAAL